MGTCTTGKNPASLDASTGKWSGEKHELRQACGRSARDSISLVLLVSVAYSFAALLSTFQSTPRLLWSVVRGTEIPKAGSASFRLWFVPVRASMGTDDESATWAIKASSTFNGRKPDVINFVLL